MNRNHFKISSTFCLLVVFVANNLFAANKYVITGGPCTGKTTMIEALKEQGYKTIQESATEIIKEEQANGVKAPQAEESFNSKVVGRQVKEEVEVGKEKEVFLDRSMIDPVAYCRFYGFDVPQDVMDKIKQSHNYKVVFLLDFISENQHKNGIRIESQQEAENIHKKIKKTYESFGYMLITVPLLPVKERTEFILNKVREIE
jgi:predicted ATPase